MKASKRYAPLVLALTLLLLTSCSATAAPQASAATETAWLLPTHAKLYVIGDSWASGYAADPKHTLMQVAAADLKWSVKVNAIAGTGYINTHGVPGDDYVTRSEAKIPGYSPNVILVQGTGNDYGDSLKTLRARALSVVKNLRANYPKAHIVLLGPGADMQQNINSYTSLDNTLAAVAKTDKLAYISMYKDKWITPANFTKVIDVQTGHPSLAGHRYLGHKLSAALKKLIKR